MTTTQPSTPTVIARLEAGDRGHPGNGYCIIRGKVTMQPDGTFLAFAKAEHGSNQGCLEPHDVEKVEGEGETVAEAVEAIAGEVMDLDYLEPYQRRQFLRDLQREAEGTLIPEGPDEDIARVCAGDEGTPGRDYSLARATAKRFTQGGAERFVVALHAEWGGNQGILLPTAKADLSVVADSIDDAIGVLREEIDELDKIFSVSALRDMLDELSADAAAEMARREQGVPALQNG